MLKNKKICITGTDRGVGLALVKALLGNGNTVFAGGIMRENEEIDRLRKQYPDQLHAFLLDVSSDESVKKAAAYIASRTDELDMLINNAAILGNTDKTIMDELDFDEIQHVLNVTALGAIRMSHALIGPIMNGGKLIVQISSEAGSIQNSHREGWYGYCMAKAALNMGSTIIHNQIRKSGGRVLVLHPGWVKTYMSGSWNPEGPLHPEDSAKFILQRIEERQDEIREKPIYMEADTGKEIPW